jgi:hypothetical protein
LVRKKNFVDDVDDAIGVEDVTVRHRGVINLKNISENIESVGEQLAEWNTWT